MTTVTEAEAAIRRLGEALQAKAVADRALREARAALPPLTLAQRRECRRSPKYEERLDKYRHSLVASEIKARDEAWDAVRCAHLDIEAVALAMVGA